MLKEINKINNISYTVKRNPILSVIINGVEYKIQTIGDVHLGKHSKLEYLIINWEKENSLNYNC